MNIDLLKKYQNRNAIREVLGSLIKNPSLLIDYKIVKEDFVESFYKIIFVAINNLANLGTIKLNSQVIEEYLKNNYPPEYLIFKKNNGSLFVDKAEKFATLENF